MKPITRCLLFGLTGGLFLMELSSPTAGQSPAVEKSQQAPFSQDTCDLKRKLVNPDLSPWQSALDSREHWSKALGEGNSLEARKWCQDYVDYLKLAAKGGDVRGMVELGKMFSMGTEVFPADRKQAKEWFEKAANAGDPDSMYHLGFFAAHDVKPDKEASAKWFSKAFKAFLPKAEKGDPHSSFWVGMMYSKGQGVEQSPTEAYQWLTRSAEAGNLQAQILVAFMSREGTGCEASGATALKWFKKAGEKGDTGAMIEVALAYSEGKGVEKNESQARIWLEKAARMTDPFALRLLAEMLENGRGGAKDERQGLAYYRQAASLGEGWSALRAYQMLKEGKGGEPDEKEAMTILSRAANEYNFPPAVFELGLYEQTHGDREKGNALIEKAAKLGFVPAMKILGRLYLFPVFEPGISWNPLAGCRWLDIASDRGDGDARVLLYGFVGGSLVFLVSAIWIFLWKMNKIIKRRQALMDEEESRNGNSPPL